MKKTLKRCLLLLSAVALASNAQFNNVLTVQSIPPVAIKAGGEAVDVKARVKLNANYHVNSNTPSDQYLIPLRLTWTAAPLEVAAIEFPAPRMEKYAFSEKPLSVFTGDFDVITKFKAPATAQKGQKTLTGKLRYQACTHNACLPPRSVEVSVAVNIH